MLEGLRAQLLRVETRLRKLVSDMNGRIEKVEGDIRTIDDPVQHGFDRLDASIAKVDSLVRDKSQKTKKLIGRLSPPR